jgi:hypothetical protein
VPPAPRTDQAGWGLIARLPWPLPASPPLEPRPVVPLARHRRRGRALSFNLCKRRLLPQGQGGRSGARRHPLRIPVTGRSFGHGTLDPGAGTTPYGCSSATKRRGRAKPTTRGAKARKGLAIQESAVVRRCGGFQGVGRNPTEASQQAAPQTAKERGGFMAMPENSWEPLLIPIASRPGLVETCKIRGFPKPWQ